LKPYENDFLCELKNHLLMVDGFHLLMVDGFHLLMVDG
jgi:hypothetical protein